VVKVIEGVAALCRAQIHRISGNKYISWTVDIWKL